MPPFPASKTRRAPLSRSASASTLAASRTVTQTRSTAAREEVEGEGKGEEEEAAARRASGRLGRRARRDLRRGHGLGSRADAELVVAQGGTRVGVRRFAARGVGSHVQRLRVRVEGGRLGAEDSEVGALERGRGAVDDVEEACLARHALDVPDALDGVAEGDEGHDVVRAKARELLGAAHAGDARADDDAVRRGGGGGRRGAPAARRGAGRGRVHLARRGAGALVVVVHDAGGDEDVARNAAAPRQARAADPAHPGTPRAS